MFTSDSITPSNTANTFAHGIVLCQNVNDDCWIALFHCFLFLFIIFSLWCHTCCLLQANNIGALKDGLDPDWYLCTGPCRPVLYCIYSMSLFFFFFSKCHNVFITLIHDYYFLCYCFSNLYFLHPKLGQKGFIEKK